MNRHNSDILISVFCGDFPPANLSYLYKMCKDKIDLFNFQANRLTYNIWSNRVISPRRNMCSLQLALLAFYCNLYRCCACGGQTRGKSLLDLELVQTWWFVDDWLCQTHTVWAKLFCSGCKKRKSKISVCEPGRPSGHSGHNIKP